MTVSLRIPLKVDRLTRSLADFAKIVDVLDAKGASFVSVTQAFNTTTSMGRQERREILGRRLRQLFAVLTVRRTAAYPNCLIICELRQAVIEAPSRHAWALLKIEGPAPRW